jgi:hypothetical protein
LNPFSSGETYRFSMVSAVFSVASSTCNPEVFKELLLSFNIIIALAEGMSTKADVAKNYRSATQDMFPFQGLFCYDDTYG